MASSFALSLFNGRQGVWLPPLAEAHSTTKRKKVNRGKQGSRRSFRASPLRSGKESRQETNVATGKGHVRQLPFQTSRGTVAKFHFCGIVPRVSGRSSAGRTPPCQGEGHGFESRRPLFFWRRSQVVRQGSAKPLFVGSIPTVAFLPQRNNGHLPEGARFSSLGAVAKLADAVDLKSSARKSVRVRIPPAPPKTPAPGGRFAS